MRGKCRPLLFLGWMGWVFSRPVGFLGAMPLSGHQHSRISWESRHWRVPDGGCQTEASGQGLGQLEKRVQLKKKKKDLKIFSSPQFYPSIPKGRAVYLHVESKSWKRVPFPSLTWIHQIQANAHAGRVHNDWKNKGKRRKSRAFCKQTAFIPFPATISYEDLGVYAICLYWNRQ